MRIPGLKAATDRAAGSKTIRHILAAVLAWSLCCLTACGVALVWLVWAGKVDMASGTTLGGFFTIFSGIALFTLRALAGGVRAAQADGSTGGGAEDPAAPEGSGAGEPG